MSEIYEDLWPCHKKMRHLWCDRDGPGDFMGHTCQPHSRALQFWDYDILLEGVHAHLDNPGHGGLDRRLSGFDAV